MEFAVATVSFWESVGFDCSNWRKSNDSTQAMVHLQYAMDLVPNVASNSNVAVYNSPSDALTTLLSSAEWTVADD